MKSDVENWDRLKPLGTGLNNQLKKMTDMEQKYLKEICINLQKLTEIFERMAPDPKNMVKMTKNTCEKSGDFTCEKF